MFSEMKESHHVENRRRSDHRSHNAGSLWMQSRPEHFLLIPDRKYDSVGLIDSHYRRGIEMKTSTLITLTVILIVVFVAGFWLAQSAGFGNKHSPVPPISSIEAISNLATLKVQIADIVTGENKHWHARWMLHGEAVLGVDLSKASYLHINQQNRRATLSLPAPHVISSKVDHHRSMEISAKQKTWIPSPGIKSLREEVWRHADEKVARLAQNDRYLEATRLQAERVLNKFFHDLGWEVSYEWQTTPVPGPEASIVNR